MLLLLLLLLLPNTIAYVTIYTVTKIHVWYQAIQSILNLLFTILTTEIISEQISSDTFITKTCSAARRDRCFSK